MSDCCLARLRTLTREVREGCIYMLLFDLITCVHYSEIMDEFYGFEKDQNNVGAPKYLVRESIPPRRYASHIALVFSICEPSSSLEEESCDTLMEEDAKVSSSTTIDGRIVEYRDKVIGFSQTDVTLASRFP